MSYVIHEFKLFGAKPFIPDHLKNKVDIRKNDVEYVAPENNKVALIDYMIPLNGEPKLNE